LDFGTVLDTITPLRPNPAFSFPLEHNDVAQLEPPSLEEDNLSHFVMAPQLTRLASLSKAHDSDADSSSSGSEGSSSEDDSSDSEADNDDPFVESMADQSRNLQQSVSDLSTQLSTTPEAVLSNSMNSLASSAPAAANRQSGTSMKRLRNVKTMLASYVKAPDASAASSNTVVKQSHSEASTPVARSTFDTKDNAMPSIVATESLNSENRKRLKSVELSKSNAPTQPLPRKGSNSKRMTSFSSTMDAGLSEDSSSDSEGEESGEVTNSDSEDEATKPTPAKLAKWDNNSSAPMPTESSSSKGKCGLELCISISRQYYSGRSLATPVTTPKSPVSYAYHITHTHTHTLLLHAHIHTT